MNTRILTIAASFVASIAFGQMNQGYGPPQTQPQQIPQPNTGGQQKTTTTTTKKVMPVGVKGYLDEQIANSKDKKFHLTANGTDIALTPFHVWAQKSTGPNSTSTSVSMRSDEGRVYDIDFVTTGKDVTGINVLRINGESVR